MFKHGIKNRIATAIIMGIISRPVAKWVSNLLAELGV